MLNYVDNTGFKKEHRHPDKVFHTNKALVP
jgi:hypothetical protein